MVARRKKEIRILSFMVVLVLVLCFFAVRGVLKQRFVLAESTLGLITVFRESTSQENLYL
jgi:hypothetical protein